jgi:hypothetical protein
MKKIIFWGSLILLTSCAGTHDQSRPREISTFYANSQPRTQFFLKGARADSTVTLFDTNGTVLTSGNAKDKDFEIEKMSYRSPLDSSVLSPYRSMALAKELNRIFLGFSERYRTFFIDSPPGECLFVLWINSKGMIEHAVCKRAFHISDVVLSSVIGELERVELPPHTVSKGAIMEMKFIICP